MVKIGQNVDILAKVYLVHLKVETPSNLMCSKYILQVKMSRPFLIGNLSIVLLRVVKMTSQKCPCVHMNRQMALLI